VYIGVYIRTGQWPPWPFLRLRDGQTLHYRSGSTVCCSCVVYDIYIGICAPSYRCNIIFGNGASDVTLREYEMHQLHKHTWRPLCIYLSIHINKYYNNITLTRAPDLYQSTWTEGQKNNNNWRQEKVLKKTTTPDNIVLMY